ncbi:DUF4817 domain-containing protein [Trichonephila clavipes]|nr:DUF4817 domain-containing protein [Trichonephila clavipes]
MVQVVDSWPAGHEFEPCITEDPPCRGASGARVHALDFFPIDYNSKSVFFFQPNHHQARHRFVEWAQNEIAVVPHFHKRILFSDEAHFWLNGYVNKQNCRIWSEANPQVCVETPLHPEKLTVWCALWAGGIIGLYFFKNDEGHNVTVNGDRYRAMITNFFIPELNNHDVQELWFQQDGVAAATCLTQFEPGQSLNLSRAETSSRCPRVAEQCDVNIQSINQSIQQDGATCHTARATIDLLKDTFGDRLISRFGPVNWPPRSCDLTPLDYFLWGYVKSLVYADKPQTLDHLEDKIRRVIADIRPQMLEKVIENRTPILDYIRASRLKEFDSTKSIEIFHKNPIVRKNIKMPLLKAFVCQAFGFVLYNYLSDPFLEAKILPENIANPVLAVVIAFLCFLLQVYTDSSDDMDDYETSSRRSRHRKTSNKTETSDFMGPNRLSRTGIPEPTFFRRDVRDTVMSGSNIDELIYKMAAVERVLEQTAQSARANTVFAMPDIISVEREVYTTKQNAAETVNDIDATKPDIIAAEIHVEIESTGETVDDEDQNEESEVQGKENEDDEEEAEETEGEKHEVHKKHEVNSAQEEEDAYEEEEEENEAKSDSVQEEEEEEDEVTVIDALNKSKEKATVKMSTTDETESEEENETNNEVNIEKKKEAKDESEEEEEETNKSEDASKKNGDPRKKKGIKRSSEKERDSVESAISAPMAPKTNENKPTTEMPIPVSTFHEVEVTPVVSEISNKEAATSSDILQDSAVEETEIPSSKMVECSSIQKCNDVSILEDVLKLVSEIDKSTVKSDSNANVSVISNGNEMWSILSEKNKKEANETALDQPGLSVQSEKNTFSSLQRTLEVIHITNDAIAASEFLSNIENSVSKGVKTSLDKEAIKKCTGDEAINEAQMRKPVNGVDVAESLKITMTEQVSHNKVIDSAKSEAKATLNGFDTESMLPTDDIQQTIPATLDATDSETKKEVILNGILPETNSFSDEEMKEILNHDSEQLNSVEADFCEEGMTTQLKAKELVLEQMNVPAINGFLPKSSDEVNSKSSASESLSDTSTETLSTLDNTPKEADVMKVPIHTKMNEDNRVSLSDNSTLHDEKNNLSTSSEKINEESKDAIESNSTVMELSTKEDNSTALVMEMNAIEETNVDVDIATFRQEAFPSTVLKDEEIDVTESIITVDEKALLTEIEKSKPNLPAREASIVSEDVSKIPSIPKTETAVGEEMYLVKQLPVDVSFLYRCLPQNNSCDTCIVLNSKMDYVFKFLET